MARTFLTTAVRDAVANLLKTNAEVVATGATIVTRAPGQFMANVQESLAKLVLAVVVMPCEVVRVNANTMPPVVEELRVTLSVSESVLNKGVEGEELAELLLVLLHGIALPAVGPEVVLYVEESPWRIEDTAGRLAVTTVSFRCIGLPAQPAQAP